MAKKGEINIRRGEINIRRKRGKVESYITEYTV